MDRMFHSLDGEGVVAEAGGAAVRNTYRKRDGKGADGEGDGSREIR